MQREDELAFRDAVVDVADRLPASLVPHDHAAGAVVALGDLALETAVVERMVLDLHRHALLRRVEARPLGHGPREQHAVPLQPEVVVQPRRPVLLDHEGESRRAAPRRACRAARGLGRRGEVASRLVARQRRVGACGGAGHGGIEADRMPAVRARRRPSAGRPEPARVTVVRRAAAAPPNRWPDSGRGSAAGPARRRSRACGPAARASRSAVPGAPAARRGRRGCRRRTAG